MLRRAMCTPLAPRPCSPRPHMHRRCAARVVCVCVLISSQVLKIVMSQRETTCTQFDATVGRTFGRQWHRRHLDCEGDPFGRSFRVDAQRMDDAGAGRSDIQKKVYARVTKMMFERRALCCVCKNNVLHSII